MTSIRFQKLDKLRGSERTVDSCDKTKSAPQKNQLQEKDTTKNDFEPQTGSEH